MNIPVLSLLYIAPAVYHGSRLIFFLFPDIILIFFSIFFWLFFLSYILRSHYSSYVIFVYFAQPLLLLFLLLFFSFPQVVCHFEILLPLFGFTITDLSRLIPPPPPHRFWLLFLPFFISFLFSAVFFFSGILVLFLCFISSFLFLFFFTYAVFFQIYSFVSWFYIIFNFFSLFFYGNRAVPFTTVLYLFILFVITDLFLSPLSFVSFLFYFLYDDRCFPCNNVFYRVYFFILLVITDRSFPCNSVFFLFYFLYVNWWSFPCLVVVLFCF